MADGKILVDDDQLAGVELSKEEKNQLIKELEETAQKRGETLEVYLMPFEKYAPEYTKELKELLGLNLKS